MAKRTREEIQNILKNPANRTFIQKAQRYENRLKFHGDIAMEHSDVVSSANDFLKWVEGLLPKDKYMTFLSLFTYPVYTNEVTQTVYSNLKKVFDGKNPFTQVEFSNPDLERDWSEYFEKELNGKDHWQEETWRRMIASINSIMVVDLDQLQKSNKPEPYYYFLDISTVWDFKIIDKDELEYLVYKLNEETLVFLDAYAYRVFTLKDGAITEELVDNNHDLGYTPARFFWTDEISYSSNLKGQPVSNQLGNLDWLLFYAIGKRQAELVGQYAIYWGYEQECDFENESTGHHCDGGFLKNQNGNYDIDRTGKVAKCPVCSDKRLTGAGSFVEVPIPDADKGERGLGAPVGVIQVDINALNYNKAELKELENNFIKNCVGVHNDPKNDQAMNELQITASYENRVSVLVDLKKNFEKAEEWVLKTICTLRYGNLFKNAVVNYGTDFYLFSTSELIQRYKNAKEAGASDNQLDYIQYQLLETEHKSNPIELERALILLHLEPYRHQTKKELIDLYKVDKSLIDLELFLIKLSFSNFIDRFEREQMSLVQWGKQLDFHVKINRITKILQNYVREQNRGQEQQEGAGQQGAGGQPDQQSRLEVQRSQQESTAISNGGVEAQPI